MIGPAATISFRQLVAALPRLPRFRRPVPRRVRWWQVAGSLLGVAGLAVGAEAAMRARLIDDRQLAPTRIYSAPLVLERGGAFDPDRLETHLRRLGYRQIRRGRPGPGEYVRGSNEWVIGRRAFRHLGLVEHGGTALIRTGWGDRIEWLEGPDRAPLDAAVVEPELLALAGGDAGSDRVPVLLDQVPEHFVDAVLAVEDQRFFAHGGLDVWRVGGAALANAKAGRVVEGASTITQQLARSRFLTTRRSVLRKVREAAMAVVLEARYDKARILEAYLNEVYLGQFQGRAIRGVGRAAQVWFGKDVGELSVPESALLAGMIRGPNLYHPIRDADVARERRDLVLRLMWRRGALSESAHRAAVAAPLGVAPHRAAPVDARYFVDLVRAQLNDRFGGRVPAGLSVFTTLDSYYQSVAAAAVRTEIATLERRHGQLAQSTDRLQAALVAIDPHTGRLLAHVGGRDYGTSQFDRATRARRQPGSAFKPVVALAALARRSDESTAPQFTLATVLDDAPLSVETEEGQWTPVNYDGRFRGPVTLRDALERSLNVPFARLGLAVGPGRVVETARALGIESRLAPYPSIALGAFEVTPLELTRAFGVFAAEGWRADVEVIAAILDPAYRVHRTAPTGETVFSPAETFLVTSALSGAVDRGTGRGVRSRGYHGAVAAKSGTSSDHRDAWFVGYTPSIAVGVWVGFDDGRSVGLPGSQAALPIFTRFLDAARPGVRESFPLPEGIEILAVDPATGLRGGPGCWGVAEVFLRGTAPEDSCREGFFTSMGRNARAALRDARDALSDVFRRLSGRR